MFMVLLKHLMNTAEQVIPIIYLFRFIREQMRLSLISMALLNSCLKDSRYIDFAGSKPLVELPAATGVAGTGLFQTASFAISTTPTPLNVLVNVAAPKPLSNDLTVRLSVDQAALTAYNKANGTSYTLLPAADYNSTLMVTIPANQNSANLIVNINSNLIDPSNTNYVLPLTITDASGQQISNYKTLLYNVTVKNAYDGNYTVTGYKFHPTAPHALSGTYALTTVSALTTQCPVGDLGGSNYYFRFDTNNGVISNYVPVGATPAAPSSGLMTEDVPAPGGSAFAVAQTQDNAVPGQTPYTHTVYNNTYNSSTKTFYIQMGYGSGSTGQSGYTRQFYMKLVKQ
ncbi:MAG: DUF1735 domain-containing protein [Sphingobacteriaceae bacterium]|nr:MAG: DUF1735 domain-containing protein [Sphingobacteriaceae bacterium]